MKKIAMAVAALSAPLVASNALAYSLIVKNNTDQPVMPFVQSLEESLAVDSVNSWINPDKERIYDLRSSWLTSGAMDVKKGDVRHVEIGGADCGDVTFEGVQSITIDQTEEGLSCNITNVPQVTESSNYIYPVAKTNVSYAIADFDNKADQDRPEKYAVGPEKMIVGGGQYVKTKVQINAINAKTGEEYPVFVEMSRYVGVDGMHKNMNDAATVNGSKISDFHASYRPELNKDLPKGEYVGITKIWGERYSGNNPHWANFGVVINKK